LRRAHRFSRNEKARAHNSGGFKNDPNKLVKTAFNPINTGVMSYQINSILTDFKALRAGPWPMFPGFAGSPTAVSGIVQG